MKACYICPPKATLSLVAPSETLALSPSLALSPLRWIMHAFLTQIVLLGDWVESLIGSKFSCPLRNREKGLQRSACVYPRDAADNCRGGVLIELFVSLVPITLIGFVVFSPTTLNGSLRLWGSGTNVWDLVSSIESEGRAGDDTTLCVFVRL